MERRYRLTKSTDFKRVWRQGHSYAHPLIVLIALTNNGSQTRFGITAGRVLGGAAKRNRVKRQLRAALHPLLPHIPPGWDIILLARRPITQSSFKEIQAAVVSLLRRANLLNADDEINH
ncbi:MAG: ribonuclease P protein component [Chloroflexota bacterium]